jgi:hypothetical protein
MKARARKDSQMGGAGAKNKPPPNKRGDRRLERERHNARMMREGCGVRCRAGAKSRDFCVGGKRVGHKTFRLFVPQGMPRCALCAGIELQLHLTLNRNLPGPLKPRRGYANRTYHDEKLIRYFINAEHISLLPSTPPLFSSRNPADDPFQNGMRDRSSQAHIGTFKGFNIIARDSYRLIDERAFDNCFSWTKADTPFIPFTSNYERALKIRRRLIKEGRNTPSLQSFKWTAQCLRRVQRC